MAKRKLTRNQSRRIRSKHQASRQRTIDFDESNLGPELEGRIIAHFGSQIEVEDADGNTTRCFFRAYVDQLVTGDRVVWRQCINTEVDEPASETSEENQAPQNQGVVVACHDRNSLLSRPDTFGKLKPVAANVDQIIITIAPKPEFHTNLIDRYLVVSEINHIQPIILINKADLITEENAESFQTLKTQYEGLGYEVLTISAKQAEGLTPLIDLVKDKTSIFVGQSGVGKSSTIQKLIPDLDIQIGKLSDAKDKGRHTTTNSQLFHFPEGGECIDSPGIREFGLWHLEKEDVITGFRELDRYQGHCKFRDCAHGNEPGCAIREAVENGEVSQGRFESYKRIVASLGDVEIKPDDF